MDTYFISGSQTLDSRLWTLDAHLRTLDLFSLLVDYGHVDSGLWTRNSGLVVLNTSLSGIFNTSPVMVGSMLISAPGLHLYSYGVLQSILKSSMFAITAVLILPGEGGWWICRFHLREFLSYQNGGQIRGFIIGWSIIIYA